MEYSISLRLANCDKSLIKLIKNAKIYTFFVNFSPFNNPD